MELLSWLISQSHRKRYSLIFGAFTTKGCKTATISSCMSVFSPRVRSIVSLMILSCNWMLESFTKYVKMFEFCIKPDNNKGHFTIASERTSRETAAYLSKYLSKRKMFQREILDKTETHFMPLVPQ
jgi:hypothetical protein